MAAPSDSAAWMTNLPEVARISDEQDEPVEEGSDSKAGEHSLSNGIQTGEATEDDGDTIVEIQPVASNFTKPLMPRRISSSGGFHKYLGSEKAKSKGVERYCICAGPFGVPMVAKLAYIPGRTLLKEWQSVWYNPFYWLLVITVFSSLFVHKVLRVVVIIEISMLACLGAACMEIASSLDDQITVSYEYDPNKPGDKAKQKKKAQKKLDKKVEKRQNGEPGEYTYIAAIMFVVMMLYHYFAVGLLCFFSLFLYALYLAIMILLWPMFLLHEYIANKQYEKKWEKQQQQQLEGSGSTTGGQDVVVDVGDGALQIDPSEEDLFDSNGVDDGKSATPQQPSKTLEPAIESGNDGLTFGFEENPVVDVAFEYNNNDLVGPAIPSSTTAENSNSMPLPGSADNTSSS